MEYLPTAGGLSFLVGLIGLLVRSLMSQSKAQLELINYWKSAVNESEIRCAKRIDELEEEIRALRAIVKREHPNA